MFSVQDVKEILEDWCSQIAEAYGDEVATYYRAGLLDAVELMKVLAAINTQGEERIDQSITLSRAFSGSINNTTGGIN